MAQLACFRLRDSRVREIEKAQTPQITHSFFVLMRHAYYLSESLEQAMAKTESGTIF